MKKITDNFYLITKKGEKWNNKQIKILKKNCHYSMFKPIPRSYVDYILYGSFNKITGKCEYRPPDMVMLNFDSCNGKRKSIRGLICVSFNGFVTVGKYGNKKYKEYKYCYTDLIGNKSISNSIASSIKKNKNVVIKSGKDMINFWLRYGKKKFNYFKLFAMEDVIGFYWKCGFKFNYSKDALSLYKNKKWDDLIKKLNEYNKLLKRRHTGREKQRKEFDIYLEKHFNKFMEGYYNLNYLSKNMYSSDMRYNNTLLENKYNLRYHGYSMYYHF